MKNSKVFLLFLSFIILAFTSCLKDRNITDQVYGDYGMDKGKFVEFNEAPLVNMAVDAMNKDTTFGFATIRLNSNEPASQDIQITLALDQPTLTKYNDEKRAEAEANEEHYEDYVIPASSKYKFENLTVTIPKGEREATLNITLNPNNYLDAKYAIPLKIVSSSVPEYLLTANYNSLLTTIAIKNKYDGVYKLTGYHNRVPYNFPYETTVHLITLDANSVAVFWPDADDFGHPIGVGPNNALSWYGNTMVPAFVLDLTTNNVTSAYNYAGGTVVSLYTSSTGPGAMENKYDPATKTLKVSWNYANNPMRAFFDTYEYIGPR